MKEDDAMATAVSPSEDVTAGQIGKIQDLLGAGLRKSGLQGAPVQQAIEQQGDTLAAELVAVVRKYAEMFISMIVRLVRVNRARTPQEAIKATGRVQYVNDDVVVSMPRGDGEEKKVTFFKLSRYVSDDNLEKEYELRGLKPADPYTTAAVNEADPAFADEHPNATHWKDSNGKWCYAAFRHWRVKRCVGVGRGGSGWLAYWWFAGVSK